MCAFHWRLDKALGLFLRVDLFKFLIIGASIMSGVLWAALPTTSSSLLQVNAHTREAEARLKHAIDNPEYVLEHWIRLPTAPLSRGSAVQRLSLKDAILLALRYNPNVQSAELDRIIQRYQLRLARNEFELQYALAGQAGATRSRYSGAGTGVTQNYMATPEFDLKTKMGGHVGLKMDNSAAAIGNYNPLLSFSFSQPLLRGFGRAANEASLLDAIDGETLNKLNLKQSVIDQITQVITAYRAMILSSNNFQMQQRQLTDAIQSFDINEKKIAAGQLEPTANIQQSYQIESLKLMMEQAENDFKTSAQNLLESIGLDPETPLSVPNDVALVQLTIPDVSSSIAQALAHNAAYQALLMGFRADKRAYRVAKNQQLWQLDLTTNVQAGTLTNVDNNAKGLRNIYSGNNTSESANVMLTIPLNDISRKHTLIAAKIRLEKDRLHCLAAKRALITTVKNAINTIESLAKRHALAKRQVELAAKAYALEKKKQEAGIASALDVTQTQNQWIQAQTGLISSKIAYLNQISALHRILGTTLEEWQIRLRYGG